MSVADHYTYDAPSPPVVTATVLGGKAVTRSALAGGTGPAASGKSPVRLAVLYMPNGVNPHHWTPTSAGSDFELTPILQPLASFKDDLLVLKGRNYVLTNKAEKLSSVAQSIVWMVTPLPVVTMPTMRSPGIGWQQPP